MNFRSAIAFLKRTQIVPRQFAGVHHIDVGYQYTGGRRKNTLCIRFHVYRKHSTELLGESIIPKFIGQYKTDVVVSNPILNSRSDLRYPSLTGGIQIQNISYNESGTLGLICYDINHNIVGLSNYHVIYGSADTPSKSIVQPREISVNPNDIIGTSSDYNEDYDCAVFLINNIRPNLTDQILGFNTINQLRPPKIGQQVKKSGAISEITYGIIEGISTNGQLTISANPSKPNPDNVIAIIGDSGAIWILDDGNDSTAIGLHYASDGDWSKAYAYDINIVFNKLNLSLQ